MLVVKLAWCAYAYHLWRARNEIKHGKHWSR